MSGPASSLAAVRIAWSGDEGIDARSVATESADAHGRVGRDQPFVLSVLQDHPQDGDDVPHGEAGSALGL